MVGLVTLRQDGRVKISVARPRVTVLDRRPRDAVQSAVLEAVPDKGMALPRLVRQFAESAEVNEIAVSLRARRLVRRHGRNGRRSLSVRGRRLRKRLIDHAPAEFQLAVRGIEAIDDAELRRIFAPPDSWKPIQYECGPLPIDNTARDRSGELGTMLDF